MSLTQKYGVECFGATRSQAGRLTNEDTFIIDRDPVPYAAVFDGAGKAEQAAERVALFFRRLIRDEQGMARDPDVWAAWVRLMDSHLMGGPQSTFVGAAVPDPGAALVVGAYAGNSLAYLAVEDGVRLITSVSSPALLGSGHALGRVFSLELRANDILLLMSDGAYLPFESAGVFRNVVSRAALRHFSEVPQAVLDAATPPEGPADDMTVVALRVRQIK